MSLRRRLAEDAASDALHLALFSRTCPLTLVIEISGKLGGPANPNTRLTRLTKRRAMRVNVDQQSSWNLEPGSERNAVGAALRRALPKRSNRLPRELETLLDGLGPQPDREGDRCAKRID